MSRRKKKSKRPGSAKERAISKEPGEMATAGTTLAERSDLSTEISPPSTPRTRTLLYLAVSLTVVWCLGLILLAATTANPVTVNRRQVLKATYVVTATVTDSERGTLKIQKEWKQASDLKSLTVDNLDKTNAKPGRTYLMPLSKVGKNGFRVTESDFANGQPLVYPATADAIAQLERLLNADR